MIELSEKDDDNMFVIIIGNEDETGAVETTDVQSVSVKVEPMDPSVDDIANILETATKHGEVINIKQEVNTVDECEFNEKQDENYIPKKGFKEKQHKISERANFIKAAEKPRSFVAKLRTQFPEMENDEIALMKHLIQIMREEIPPKPPLNYCEIKKDLKYKCSFCSRETSTEPAASRHYQDHHGQRYLECYSCGLQFRSKTNLYRHEKRCVAPDAQLVLRARGEFLGRKGRSRPYRTLNKFVPAGATYVSDEFICSICKAQFSSKQTLNAHELFHKGIRPYQCHMCPKAYTSRRNLSKHIKWHSGRQYTCDLCGKSFFSKHNLVAHLNIHFPKKGKIKCLMCGRSFNFKCSLMHHINKDHLKLPPPCACAVCPKRYYRMNNLKEHMQKEHELTLMTQKMFVRELPSMTQSDLENPKPAIGSNVMKKQLRKIT